MQKGFGIYYNGQLLYTSHDQARNTSSTWHKERLKAIDQVQLQFGIHRDDFDNSLYKVKKLEVTDEVKIECLLKSIKASDIQLLKEYFKRDQS